MEPPTFAHAGHYFVYSMELVRVVVIQRKMRIAAKLVESVCSAVREGQ
jgi:hypothetical protein